MGRPAVRPFNVLEPVMVGVFLSPPYSGLLDYYLPHPMLTERETARSC